MIEKLAAYLPTEVFQKHKQLPDYGLLYFDHLYGEFRSLFQDSRKECIQNRENLRVATSPQTGEQPSTLNDFQEKKKTEQLNPFVSQLLEKKQQGSLAWEDLYTFELLLTKCHPSEQLGQRLRDLRSRYRGVAGAAAYDAYIASKPPDLDDTSHDAEVQADLEYLLSQLYLRYAIKPIREALRRKLSRQVVYWTILGVIVILLSVAIANGKLWDQAEVLTTLATSVSTLAVVMFVGSMGALASMQQRFQSLPDDGDVIDSVSELSLVGSSSNILLSVVSGAVFAAVLYLIIAAGLVSGSFFPKIESYNLTNTTTQAGTRSDDAHMLSRSQEADTELREPVITDMEKSRTAPSSEQSTDNSAESAGRKSDEHVATVWKFVRETSPTNSADFAKLIVWSFLAGFAERLVPDTLSRFVARKEE